MRKRIAKGAARAKSHKVKPSLASVKARRQAAKGIRISKKGSPAVKKGVRSKKRNQASISFFAPHHDHLHHREYGWSHHGGSYLHHRMVKVPVVLAEKTLQIPVDTVIRFPEPVLEIKDIKKRLKLTQCRLLLPTNKLFIRGFVRKNIQYATPIEQRSGAVRSRLRSMTVDVPFNDVLELKLNQHPQLFPNFRREFEYFTSTPLPQGFPAKERLLAGDLSEFNQISKEVFNELPFCELISAKIIEMDEALDRESLPGGPFEEGTFTRMEEKMVIKLKLKVLQNQQVKL